MQRISTGRVVSGVRGWAVLVSGAICVTVAASIGFRAGERAGLEAAQRPAHPLEWNGDHWSEQLDAGEKLAYLAGFLAGAGASQAYPGPEVGDFDGEALVRRVQELRQARGLNFPYGPSLYHARLHDYYFYVDRRERPIYQAIAELNFRLQRDHH